MDAECIRPRPSWRSTWRRYERQKNMSKEKIRSTLRRALEDALDEEHPHEEDSEGYATCDVSVARYNDFPLWSAHLLGSATECPLSSAILHAIAETYESGDAYQKALDGERDGLLKVRHWQCTECNAVNWTDDMLADCDACGKGTRCPREFGEEVESFGDVNTLLHEGGVLYLRDVTRETCDARSPIRKGWSWPDIACGTAVYFERSTGETLDCDDDWSGKWMVYEFDVDDESALQDYDLEAVARTCGTTVAKLLAPWKMKASDYEVEPLKSNIPFDDYRLSLMLRSWEAVAGHCGWGELDPNPTTMTVRQIAMKYPEALR